MSWSGRRQLLVIGTIFLLILGGAFVVLYPKLNPTPTCFDGKQNGTESGVDCGGTCEKICTNTTAKVVLRWARPFMVTDDVASVVAYIENPNQNAAARDVPYEFRLYDENSQFIAVREGRAYIAPNGSSAIFEGGIKVGNRKPATARFKFLADPVWVTVDPRIEGIKLFPRDAVVTDPLTKPRLSGKVFNGSDLYAVNDVTVIGILYDKDDNAVGASQTILESIEPSGSGDVYFTWQKPFVNEPVRNEIIPRFNVFSVSFR